MLWRPKMVDFFIGFPLLTCCSRKHQKYFQTQGRAKEVVSAWLRPPQDLLPNACFLILKSKTHLARENWGHFHLSSKVIIWERIAFRCWKEGNFSWELVLNSFRFTHINFVIRAAKCDRRITVLKEDRQSRSWCDCVILNTVAILFRLLRSNRQKYPLLGRSSN